MAGKNSDSCNQFKHEISLFGSFSALQLPISFEKIAQLCIDWVFFFVLLSVEFLLRNLSTKLQIQTEFEQI